MTQTAEQIRIATFNEIIVQNDNRCEWARLLWEESTGRVFLVTAWGSWSYCWTHIGEKTLQKFLGGLDIGYAGGKFLGSSLYEHSPESTLQAIRETILRDRREGGLTKAEAAEEWEHAERLEQGHYMDFREWCENSSMDCAYEFSRKEMVGTWESFWNRIWVPKIQPILNEAG